MLPIIELRGAIPYAEYNKIPIYISILIALIGNLIPIPFVYFFSKKIIKWGINKKEFNKFFSYIENRGHKISNKLIKNGSDKVYIAIILFVGIPLPGTGAYSAVLAAALLNLNFKKTIISITLGLLLSILIMFSSIYIFKISI